MGNVVLDEVGCQPESLMYSHIIAFSDLTSYSLVDVYEHFRETGCLHLQGRREQRL
jgi:hypothetical protein